MAGGTGRLAELVRAGVAAAAAVAREQGLPAGDPRVLSGSGAGAGEALAAYAAASGTAVPDPARLAPFHRARSLEAAVWSLGMAHQYPGRYRGLARNLLAGILTAHHYPPPAGPG